MNIWTRRIQGSSALSTFSFPTFSKWRSYDGLQIADFGTAGQGGRDGTEIDLYFRVEPVVIRQHTGPGPGAPAPYHHARGHSFGSAQYFPQYFCILGKNSVFSILAKTFTKQKKKTGNFAFPVLKVGAAKQI